jgi:hypothetical protein
MICFKRVLEVPRKFHDFMRCDTKKEHHLSIIIKKVKQATHIATKYLGLIKHASEQQLFTSGAQ